MLEINELNIRLIAIYFLFFKCQAPLLTELSSVAEQEKPTDVSLAWGINEPQASDHQPSYDLATAWMETDADCDAVRK